MGGVLHPKPTRLGFFLTAMLLLTSTGWSHEPGPILIDLAGLPHKPSEVTTTTGNKTPV
jgi:hypothetical protein